MQAKDIDTDEVLEAIRACNEGRCSGDETWGWHGGGPGFGHDETEPQETHWANRWDIAKALGVEPPEKVLLAKLRRLVDRGLVFGCPCGCRGDFVLPGTAEAVRLGYS